MGPGKGGEGQAETSDSGDLIKCLGVVLDTKARTNSRKWLYRIFAENKRYGRRVEENTGTSFCNTGRGDLSEIGDNILPLLRGVAGDENKRGTFPGKSIYRLLAVGERHWGKTESNTRHRGKWLANPAKAELSGHRQLNKTYFFVYGDHFLIDVHSFISYSCCNIGGRLITPF